MYNFFEKIRFNLAKRNKPVTYIRYAIGEIVLVVFGILIALSINNWNSVRKDLQKEQIVLVQLEIEYESNLEQLRSKIAMRNSIIESGLIVLGYIDNPINVNRDSLIHKISITQVDPTFDPIQNDLISSGNLRLISNQKLKSLLSHWTSDIIAVQENELSWQSVVNDSYVPLTNRIGISRDMVQSMWKSEKEHDWALDKDLKNKLEIGNSRSPIPLSAILENKELEGMIAKAIAYNQATNVQSYSLEKRIIEVLDLVRQEIKQQ